MGAPAWVNCGFRIEMAYAGDGFERWNSSETWIVRSCGLRFL